MASAVSLGNRVARSDKGVSRGPQNRLTGQLENNGDGAMTSPDPHDPLAQWLWPTETKRRTERFSVADVFSIGQCPSYKRLEPVLGTELASLITAVKEKGYYEWFFRYTLADVKYVCRCHPLRLAHPKRAELWNDCDKTRVAKHCRYFLEHGDDVMSARLGGVYGSDGLGVWYSSDSRGQANKKALTVDERHNNPSGMPV